MSPWPAPRPRPAMPGPARMNPARGNPSHPARCPCEACYGPGGHVRLNLSMRGLGGGGNGTDHYVARRIVAPSGFPGDPRATDPTIAAALAALGPGGGLVFLLEGAHFVAAPLSVNSGVDIRGAGSAASSVTPTFVDPVSYIFTAGGGNQFSDFQITASPANVLGMIRVGSRTVVRNMRFTWMGGI